MRASIFVTLIVALIAAGAPPVRADSPEQTKLELAFWSSIKDSSDPAEFRAYLQRFPNGVFSELSRIKISTLERQRSQPTDPTAPGISRTDAAKRNSPGPPQNPFDLLDGKWVGRATPDFASQEFADCPPIVDFDVAIRAARSKAP